jgi:hypothetical protein
MTCRAVRIPEDLNVKRESVGQSGYFRHFFPVVVAYDVQESNAQPRGAERI